MLKIIKKTMGLWMNTISASFKLYGFGFVT